MTWDPIGYLINRADKLEKENQQLRGKIETVDRGLAAHHLRISSLEKFRGSVIKQGRRWPLMALVLVMGVSLNVAPQETAKFLGEVIKAVLL